MISDCDIYILPLFEPFVKGEEGFFETLRKLLAAGGKKLKNIENNS